MCVGGQLAVRYGRKNVRFDWSRQRNKGKAPVPEDGVPPSYKVKRAAFYSYCQHEVLPVTSGHRVTLTYNLYGA